MRHWTETYVVQFANDSDPNAWYDVEGLAFSRPRPAISRMSKLFEENQIRRAENLAIIPDYVCRGRVLQRLETPSGVMVELGDGKERTQARREAGQDVPGTAGEGPITAPNHGDPILNSDPIVVAGKPWRGRI